MGGNNSLTLDVSNGAPLLAGTRLTSGAGTSDTLQVVGSNGADDFIFTPGSVLAVTPLAYDGFETLNLDGRGGGDRATVIDCTVTFTGAPPNLESLTVSNGLAILPAGQPAAMLTRGLSLSDGGTLELNDNDLVVEYSGTSPIGSWTGTAYNGVTGLITTGRIHSASAAGSLTGLGIAEASDALNNTGANTTTFSGITVDSTAVLVKFTYAGDANLDGKIDIVDYGRIDSGVRVGATGWFNGDFNYDGKIDIQDYGIIDSNVRIQGAQFVTTGAALSGVTAVPEPASLGLLAAAAATGLLGRRSRARRRK
jgi:hypothetical protein